MVNKPYQPVGLVYVSSGGVKLGARLTTWFRRSYGAHVGKVTEEVCQTASHQGERPEDRQGDDRQDQTILDHGLPGLIIQQCG